MYVFNSVRYSIFFCNYMNGKKKYDGRYIGNYRDKFMRHKM